MEAGRRSSAFGLASPRVMAQGARTLAGCSSEGERQLRRLLADAGRDGQLLLLGELGRAGGQLDLDRLALARAEREGRTPELELGLDLAGLDRLGGEQRERAAAARGAGGGGGAGRPGAPGPPGG